MCLHSNSTTCLCTLNCTFAQVTTESSVFVVSSGCHKLSTRVILGGFERNLKRLSITVDITVIICYTNSLITIDNQQDATILIYLLLISSTCFGRCFRPSSTAYHCNYSFWYCPLMLLLAGVAYWVEFTSQQQHRWTTPEAVVTVICS